MSDLVAYFILASMGLAVLGAAVFAVTVSYAVVRSVCRWVSAARDRRPDGDVR